MQTVDVVIPTYKPGKELLSIIDKLNNQKYEVNKIIIINTLISDSDSYLKSMFSEYKTDLSKIEVCDIRKEEFNHGLTRNKGASLSDADFIMFMTQDAVPVDDTLVFEMIKPFSDKDVYVSYARQLPRKNCRYVEKYVRSFNYPDKDIVKTKDDFERIGIKTIFCSDVCAMYRKNALLNLEGFPKTDFNEDMIFAYKTVMAGKKVYYASDAKVIHSHNYTYFQQFKRNVEIGKSQKKFDYIFGKIKSESEGIRMIKTGIKDLIKTGKWYYIPDLILSSGFKFLGYKVGKQKKYKACK